MEKTIRVFSSFEEAEAADLEYYARLTPLERLRILFALVDPREEGSDEPEERIQKVCRIIKRSRAARISNPPGVA